MKQLALGVRLRADAVFESFVTGANAEVVAALQAPQRAPVWLWGAPNSGKTHLLQATCAAADGTAAYFPLDRSVGMPPAALQGFENCRVLCVDDVGAVSGDLEWETALFRLFNAAVELETRLVFAAHAAPRQFDWRLEDWRSRAAACVVYQVHEPDDASLVEALRLRALQRGLHLPSETGDYLLKRLPRNLRSLFEILDELDEASLIEQRRLTVPFIRGVLETLAERKP